MDECILEPENVMVIVLVHASVELGNDGQQIQVTFIHDIVLLTRSRTETSIMLWLK
jgi:hypothetical protein